MKIKYFLSIIHICDSRRRLRRQLSFALPVSFAALSASVASAHPTNVDLWRDMGVSASLLGGGVAHVTDGSAADHNPAGIGLQKTYTVSGEMGWIGQKGRQAEAGACDSTTSELAACVKFRQTQKVTGAQDRRFTLALAEAFAGGFVLGIAGDYVQFADERAANAIVAPQKNGQRLRAGLTYALGEGLFVGIRSDGLYDSTGTPSNHGAGLSAQLGQYFLVNGDMQFDSDALREMIAGVSVFPRDFLDFAISYGYDPRVSHHRFAGGVVVKSQQARLIYSVARSSENPSQLFHTVGIGIFMAGESGSR